MPLSFPLVAMQRQLRKQTQPHQPAPTPSPPPTTSNCVEMPEAGGLQELHHRMSGEAWWDATLHAEEDPDEDGSHHGKARPIGVCQSARGVGCGIHLSV